MSSDDWNDFVEGEYFSFARDWHYNPPMAKEIYPERRERVLLNLQGEELLRTRASKSFERLGPGAWHIQGKNGKEETTQFNLSFEEIIGDIQQFGRPNIENYRRNRFRLSEASEYEELEPVEEIRTIYANKLPYNENVKKWVKESDEHLHFPKENLDEYEDPEVRQEIIKGDLTKGITADSNLLDFRLETEGMFRIDEIGQLLETMRDNEAFSTQAVEYYGTEFHTRADLVYNEILEDEDDLEPHTAELTVRESEDFYEVDLLVRMRQKGEKEFIFPENNEIKISGRIDYPETTSIHQIGDSGKETEIGLYTPRTERDRRGR